MFERALRAWALTALIVDAACSSSVDKGSGGACGTAAGCNTLDDVGGIVMPTCASGPVPTGQGGTIVDGTYVLTSETYYGADCATETLSATAAISTSCIQIVSTAHDSTGSSLVLHASASFTTSGSSLVATDTCSSLTSTTSDAPMQTYTATPTSFTRFVNNTGTSSANPNRVEVLTLR